ncbi:MAG: RDD family protein [Nanoarchaeota archaeon]|nr:RDD family protein [Nanoarchaeota archaeon]
MVAHQGLNLPGQRMFAGPALLWKRMAALFLDILILNFTVLYPFRSALQRTLPAFESLSVAYTYLSTHPSLQEALVMLTFVMSLFVLAYFTLMDYQFSTTPGKALLRIAVMSDTPKMSLWQSLLRNLFVLPVFPFFLLWIADPLFLVFSRSHRRLSEMVSKTRTVEFHALQ